MLVNSNFGIITLTCHLRHELLDKSFSINVSDLINFLILFIWNQVVFNGNQRKRARECSDFSAHALARFILSSNAFLFCCSPSAILYTQEAVE